MKSTSNPATSCRTNGRAEALAAAGHEDALGLGHAGSVLEWNEERQAAAAHVGSAVITRQVFCPPKPKEFEITLVTFMSRGVGDDVERDGGIGTW